MNENAAALTTQALVERLRTGDSEAMDALCSRCLPRLQRWARSRLPHAARSVIDTDDLAQEVLVKTLRNVDHFEEMSRGGAGPAAAHAAHSPVQGSSSQGYSGMSRTTNVGQLVIPGVPGKQP